MTTQEKESPLVKSLLSVGFTEEYISDQIRSGNIIVKSVEEDIEEEEEEVEEKKVDKKKKVETEGISAEDLEKSLTGMANIFKSALDQRDEELNELKKSIETMKKETPRFRGQGLESAQVIEKSLTPKQDDDGRSVLNVHSQRASVRNVLSEMIAKEKDEDLKKSISSDAMGYLCTSEADMPQSVAQYLYDNANVRLIK